MSIVIVLSICVIIAIITFEHLCNPSDNSLNLFIINHQKSKWFLEKTCSMKNRFDNLCSKILTVSMF